MVDKAILDDLKGMMKAGAGNTSVEGTAKVFEFFKQIAQENDEMKDELTELELIFQTVITDRDKKFWMSVKDGKIEYGEGPVENPTFIFSTTWVLAFDMITGNADPTAEYMAGRIAIEGNVADAMSCQGIIELAMEIFQDMIK